MRDQSPQPGRHRFREVRRWLGRRMKGAKTCAYAMGLANLILLIFGEPTTLVLLLAVALAPFTLAMALTLTAFLAGSMLSFAMGDRLERAELLACAISTLQPPSEGEEYREAMLAQIRDAGKSDQAWGIEYTLDLLKNAPRTIFDAWARILKPFWGRARNVAGFSAERRAS